MNPTQITRAEAISQGKNRYFTGKPCCRGHVAERDTVLGDCCTCRNERQNALRKAQRQQLKEARR